MKTLDIPVKVKVFKNSTAYKDFTMKNCGWEGVRLVFCDSKGEGRIK